MQEWYLLKYLNKNSETGDTTTLKSVPTWQVSFNVQIGMHKMQFRHPNRCTLITYILLSQQYADKQSNSFFLFNKLLNYGLNVHIVLRWALK